MTEFAGLEAVPVLAEEAGNKGTCPDCGKLLTITAAGTLRSHKCINEIGTDGAGKTGTRRNKARMPASVQRLGVALVAAGVETAVAQGVSRYVPCQPSDVPADLGKNADAMIGPILDGIWPTLPKGAQRTIKALADESDLIAAAVAWWEYGRGLKTWADNEKAARSTDVKPTRGYDNEQVPSAAYRNGQSGGDFGAFEPLPDGAEAAQWP